MGDVTETDEVCKCIRHIASLLLPSFSLMAYRSKLHKDNCLLGCDAA